jgi:hypothetical protein
MVLLFLSTDSNCWLQGEREHRRVKRYYKRTNKGITFPHQIAKQERMERHYRGYVETFMKETGANSQPGVRLRTVGGRNRSPRRHYSISDRSRGYLGMYRWAYGKDANDPALKVFPSHAPTKNLTNWFHQDFVPKLLDHLLARILHQQYDSEPPHFTDAERDKVYIHGDRLEQRYTMSVYYTTYDLQRHVDKINMGGRPYVMALSHGDPSHPYLYARVLGIFRVKVLHPNLETMKNMDVLWVRWLEIDQKHRAGWKAKRLYRVQFVPPHEEGAFGFLDPTDVIRGVHLIPGFNNGHVVHLPGDSISKWDYAPAKNWQNYYVNQ